MDVIIAQAHAMHGTLSLPADKAMCHRAALLCALAAGSTELCPWSSAEDCQQTLHVLSRLGVDITRTQQGIRIHGAGLSGFQAPTAALLCGESGSTMRLACGLLAGQPFVSRLTARGSLRQRPMRRIVEPLTRMGARVEGSRQPSGDVCPPLIIHGRRPLTGLTYRLPVASAQVKSAMLLAGLFADRSTTVIEPLSTRDHTERMLKRLGVTVRQAHRAITVTPPKAELVAPGRLTIPGDLSSAAFFVAAASILPGSDLAIRDVSLNPTRMQFLKLLQRMGASIRWEYEVREGEPYGTIVVASRPLRGVTITAREVPGLIDELPILMVAACAAQGESRFQGLAELRVKETDRVHAMVAGLKRLGARIAVRGRSEVVIATSRLRGASVDSFRDHRTAMSLAVAGLLAAGQTRLRAAECVAKSFGEFFERLADVTSPSTVKIVDKG